MRAQLKPIPSAAADCSLDAFARSKLDALDRAHLRRAIVESTRTDSIWITRDGRRLLSFSCNDYLNLAQHPAVKEAAIAAIRQHGVGSGASRLVTGSHPLFTELEARLARLKQTEAACVFGSGYLANARAPCTLPPCPDRHRRHLFHGRRSRAPPGARRAGAPP